MKITITAEIPDTYADPADPSGVSLTGHSLIYTALSVLGAEDVEIKATA